MSDISEHDSMMDIAIQAVMLCIQRNNIFNSSSDIIKYAFICVKGYFHKAKTNKAKTLQKMRNQLLPMTFCKLCIMTKNCTDADNITIDSLRHILSSITNSCCCSLWIKEDCTEKWARRGNCVQFAQLIGFREAK